MSTSQKRCTYPLFASPKNPHPDKKSDCCASSRARTQHPIRYASACNHSQTIKTWGANARHVPLFPNIFPSPATDTPRRVFAHVRRAPPVLLVDNRQRLTSDSASTPSSRYSTNPYKPELTHTVQPPTSQILHPVHRGLRSNIKTRRSGTRASASIFPHSS